MKNSLGTQAVNRMARIIAKAAPNLDVRTFELKALDSLEQLELKQRVDHIIEALHTIFPNDYERSAQILLNCKEHWIEDETGDSYGVFAAWPFIDYSAKYGLEHPEIALNTLKELTSLFSAEFAIRPFIVEHYQLSMNALSTWANDSNEHVRRLVSEGTRPRLPWGLQLRNFIETPLDCLPLLSKLKTDESLYVRRSVANHLNDIAKDHPDLVLDTCMAWQKEMNTMLKNAEDTDEKSRVLTSEENKAEQTVADVNWLIRHATRTLVKAGHPKSFALLGYTKSPNIKVSAVTLMQSSIEKEETLSFRVSLENQLKKPQKFVFDYAIHFVKANGERKAKVFKFKNCELNPGQQLDLTKDHSFKKISTRKYYAGEHLLELFINGKSVASKTFSYSL